MMDGICLWVRLEEGILEQPCQPGVWLDVTKKGQSLTDVTDPGSEHQASTALVLSKSPIAEASDLSHVRQDKSFSETLNLH